jgi:hypothetical protein
VSNRQRNSKNHGTRRSESQDQSSKMPVIFDEDSSRKENANWVVWMGWLKGCHISCKYRSEIAQKITIIMIKNNRTSSKIWLATFSLVGQNEVFTLLAIALRGYQDA